LFANAEPVISIERPLRLALQCEKRGYRIGGRCTQASLQRKVLLNRHNHLSALSDRLHEAIGKAIAGVGLVGRNAWIFAADFNSRAASDFSFYQVVQRDGLIDRSQLVKTIIPNRTNDQSNIDFGVSADGGRHPDIVRRSQAAGTEAPGNKLYGLLAADV